MKPLKLMRALVLLILPCVLVISGCNGTTDAGSSGVKGFSVSEGKTSCWKDENDWMSNSTLFRVTGKIKNNTRKRAKVNLEISMFDNSDPSSSRLLWSGSFWEPTDSYIAPGVTKTFIKVFRKDWKFYENICVPTTDSTLNVTDVENA